MRNGENGVRRIINRCKKDLKEMKVKGKRAEM